MKSKAKPAAKTARSGKLKLAVQYASKAAEMPTRQQVRKWVKAALTRDAEITLRIVDETEGRSLNRDFRGQNHTTNVLTFAYNEIEDEVSVLSGDIVLCAAVVEKEAKQQRKNLLAHYAHLTIHGVLHLRGYEHENDADAAVMERLETEIVMKLGYDDPYNRG
jgi:probable rRNA maturation factor